MVKDIKLEDVKVQNKGGILSFIIGLIALVFMLLVFIVTGLIVLGVGKFCLTYLGFI